LQGACQLDDLNIVRLREGEAGFDATKQRLSEQLGKPVSFPTVEIEPGRYMSDSDRLIEHYAEPHRLIPDELPVLSLFKQTIFPKLIELHKLKTGKASRAASSGLRRGLARPRARGSANLPHEV